MNISIEKEKSQEYKRSTKISLKNYNMRLSKKKINRNITKAIDHTQTGKVGIILV